MFFNKSFICWNQSVGNQSFICKSIEILIKVNALRFLGHILNSHLFCVYFRNKLLVKSRVRQDFLSVAISTKSGVLATIKEFQDEVFKIIWVMGTITSKLDFLIADFFITFRSVWIIGVCSFFEYKWSAFHHELINNDSDRPPIRH